MNVVVRASTLHAIAEALREKTGALGSFRLSDLTTAVMSIGSGEVPETSTLPPYDGDSLIAMDETIMRDLANAIRVKSGSDSPIAPSDMAEAIMEIPSGEPVGKSGYLELMDDNMCWFNSGIASQAGLIAEARLWLPTGQVGRSYPFLFGGGEDKQVAYWSPYSAISPICFHKENASSGFNTVFREGAFYINFDYNVPTGVWITIKGDHTEAWAGSGTTGIRIRHYVDGTEIGNKIRLDGVTLWEEATHDIPSVSDLAIFAAKWKTGACRYRMPKGTRLSYLKVWAYDTLIGDFRAHESGGEACLKDEVTGNILEKQGTGIISFVEES